MNTGIAEHVSKVTTLINVFTVQPNDQQRLVDLLIEATEKVTSQQEAFISAKIHKSLDGTRVVDYAQWKSKNAYNFRTLIFLLGYFAKCTAFSINIGTGIASSPNTSIPPKGN